MARDPTHTNTESPEYLHQRAVELFRKGDVAAARSLLERVVALHEERPRALQGDTTIVLSDLADLCFLQGDLASAVRFLEQSEDVWDLVSGQDHTHAWIINYLGSVRMAQGELEDAEMDFKRAREISESLPDRDDQLFASILNNLAAVHRDLGELNEARNMLEQALEISENLPDRDDHLTVTILRNLASVHQKQGELGRAKPAFELALALSENLPDRDEAIMASILSGLASVHQEQGDLTPARSLLERALGIYASLGSDHPNTAVTRGKLAVLREESAKFETASDEIMSPSGDIKKKGGTVISLDFRNKRRIHLVWENKNYNYGKSQMVTNKEKLDQVVSKSGLSADELQQAIDLWKTVKGETTARTKLASAKAKRRPKLIRRKVVVTTTAALPPLPKGLKWPKEHFDQSLHFQRRGGIVRHLDEVWRRHIEARMVDMAVLRAFYPSTALGIDRFRKKKDPETGERLQLPPDLDIPQVSPGSGRRPADPQQKAALG
jgi:tetratricopeptide (TPR) repeat protein